MTGLFGSGLLFIQQNIAESCSPNMPFLMVLTTSVSGAGFFPRHKLDNVHVAFLLVGRFNVGSCNNSNKGSMMP